MSAFENPKARWSQRFATEDYIFGLEPNAYLRAQVKHLTIGRTLAIADGEGRNGVWLAQQGHRVDSFDFIDAAVEKARKLAQERQVSLHAVCCDWTRFDWHASTYDNIVGIFFQFLDPLERQQMFEHVHRALKPGGTFFIVDHNAAAGSGVRDIKTLHRIDPAVIKAEVTKAGFELVEDSKLLAYPSDDHTQLVFAPGLRGMTDQSVFKFRKPGKARK